MLAYNMHRILKSAFGAFLALARRRRDSKSPLIDRCVRYPLIMSRARAQAAAYVASRGGNGSLAAVKPLLPC
jgi:hypothetical protein